MRTLNRNRPKKKVRMTTQTIWGIHAGKSGDAHSLFLNKNVVAIGWTAMGDLSAIPPNREAFKAVVAKTYPNAKPGAIPNHAGQLFRFVYEMKKGDLVVYPAKSNRQIHIGEITSGYVYEPQTEGYHNVRSVRWIKSVPRLKFSQGALYEIGSAMSLFQVKNLCRLVQSSVGRKSLFNPGERRPHGSTCAKQYC